MRTALKRFLCDRSGATAIEYGLLAGLIALALVGTFSVVGNNVANLFGAGQMAGLYENQASTLD
jgi:pilus assembly protein Flp/PilA